jgi:type II secretion system (T2SS) protein E
LGLVGKARVEDALRRTRRALSLEQILVNPGVLREEQLIAVLEALKNRPNVNPARHLVEAGIVSERAYLEAFCEKHELPFIDVDVNLVDRMLVARAGVKYLVRNRLLPMSIQQGRVNIAVDQPPEKRHSGGRAHLRHAGHHLDRRGLEGHGRARRARERGRRKIPRRQGGAVSRGRAATWGGGVDTKSFVD